MSPILDWAETESSFTLLTSEVLTCHHLVRDCIRQSDRWELISETLRIEGTPLVVTGHHPAGFGGSFLPSPSNSRSLGLCSVPPTAKFRYLA